MADRLRLLALGVLGTAALVPAAHATARAPRTTAPQVYVTIQVTITDTRIRLDRRTANRGDEARFVIRNTGKKPHSFTVGSKKYATGVQTGFSRKLKPGEETVLVLFLDYRGRLPYRSIFAYDAGKPGMKGYFRIR